MEDYCIACGAIVPEGCMVCPMCEAKYSEKKPQNLSQSQLEVEGEWHSLHLTARWWRARRGRAGGKVLPPEGVNAKANEGS